MSAAAGRGRRDQRGDALTFDTDVRADEPLARGVQHHAPGQPAHQHEHLGGHRHRQLGSTPAESGCDDLDGLDENGGHRPSVAERSAGADNLVA